MNPGGIVWHSGAGWFLIAAATAIVSFLSCWLAMHLAIRAGMIVQPGVRQSHKQATPTGGGLGIVFTVVLSTLFLNFIQPLPEFWWFNMVPGILLLTFVGWLDDKKPVASVLRLLVQFIVSLWL